MFLRLTKLLPQHLPFLSQTAVKKVGISAPVPVAGIPLIALHPVQVGVYARGIFAWQAIHQIVGLLPVALFIVIKCFLVSGPGFVVLHF